MCDRVAGERICAAIAAAVHADAGMLLHGRRNTDAWQLTPDLGNQPDDLYIKDKNTYDSFQNTRLEAMLRERGVDTVIVGGLATNMCCGSTARCAADARDQHVLVVVAMQASAAALVAQSASLGCSVHGPRSAALGMRSCSHLHARRSAFTKNFNAVLLSDANNAPEKSLHEASLKEFKEAFGKVMSCEEVKEKFADHRQGSAMA